METLNNFMHGGGALCIVFSVIFFLNYFLDWRLFSIPGNLTAAIILLVAGLLMALAGFLIDRKLGIKRRW